jgi:hypothetical protein
MKEGNSQPMNITREHLQPWLPTVLVLLQILIEPSAIRNYPSLVVFFLIGATQFELFKKLNALRASIASSPKIH